tara:strand:- start:50 stop:208 length:159 start_codon:yes stop_codon:yes gene_type:complete
MFASAEGEVVIVSFVFSKFIISVFTKYLRRMNYRLEKKMSKNERKVIIGLNR